MRTDVPDPELSRLFREERLDTEAAAPVLGALLARASRRRAGASTIRRLMWAAALAAAAVAVTLCLRISSPPSRTEPPRGAIQLAEWKAPTDVLLATPGFDLWTRVPVLAPHVRAPETGVSLEATKGVER